MQGAEIGAHCTLAAASSRGGVADRRPLHVDGHRACSARASTIGAGNVVSNGARIFPGVTLPDGALLF